jgi:hypothetical protein
VHGASPPILIPYPALRSPCIYGSVGALIIFHAQESVRYLGLALARTVFTCASDKTSAIEEIQSLIVNAKDALFRVSLVSMGPKLNCGRGPLL